MRSQIPAFRLPEEVLDEEVDFVLSRGVNAIFNRRIDSLKALLKENYDAIFVGTGAPRGRDLEIPGREEAADNINIGIDWLSSVAFEHTAKIGKRVLVLGGGNTAMDCCRTARRLGGEDVKVVVRSPFETMKASDWEKEDAMAEDIPIFDNHVPKAFVVEQGKLVAMEFEKVRVEFDENNRRKLVPTGEPLARFDCDDVLIAIGQENAFPWIERDIGLEMDQWDCPVLDKKSFQSSLPHVFFGGDAAFGPENIITAVAHGHQAAISIDLYCQGKSVTDERPGPAVNLTSQKMGIHEWSYDSGISNDVRQLVPHMEKGKALSDRKLEVELGFSTDIGFQEAQRCLNCDVQTVFTEVKCIECDACVDICPMDCISFVENQEEDQLRVGLTAPAGNLAQDLYVSEQLKTERVMVKDENVCLHCGLCAERCPTSAWDMQKFLYSVAKATEIL